MTVIELPPPEKGRPLPIKSRQVKPGEMPHTGLLFVPVYDGTWRCDADLYAAVKRHGKAVIGVHKKDNPFTLESTLVLSPDQFEKEWKGD